MLFKAWIAKSNTNWDLFTMRQHRKRTPVLKTALTTTNWVYFCTRVRFFLYSWFTYCSNSADILYILVKCAANFKLFDSVVYKRPFTGHVLYTSFQFSCNNKCVMKRHQKRSSIFRSKHCRNTEYAGYRGCSTTFSHSITA